MSRDGSGNYSLPSGNPVVSNTVISSTWANNTLSDVASALTQSVSRDGQTTPTANLTMGNFRLTNLGSGTTRTDAVNAGQIQDNQLVVLSSIGGTGDAITASTAPAITVYTTDAKWVYTPTNANTLTNPTININGLGAKTITQSNGSGLWSGALVVGTPYELLYDGTNFRVQSGQLGGQIVQMGSQFTMRNRLIDADFIFWSVGPSVNCPANVSTYTADMWQCFPGNGTGTATQQILAPGTEPAGMTTPITTYLRYTQNTNSVGSLPSIGTKMEFVRSLEGRSATLSIWLWTQSGTVTSPSCFVNQFFGSSGSAALLTIVNTGWVLTTTPQKFSVRVDVPSIAGKTVSGGNDRLELGVQFPQGATYSINTTQWQFEDCPANAPAIGIPTPYEVIHPSITQLMIARYFEKIGGDAANDLLIQTVATAGGQNLGVSIPYKNKKRGFPACSVVGTWNATNCGQPSAAATGLTTQYLAVQSTAAGAVLSSTTGTGTYVIADARL